MRWSGLSAVGGAGAFRPVRGDLSRAGGAVTDPAADRLDHELAAVLVGDVGLELVGALFSRTMSPVRIAAVRISPSPRRAHRSHAVGCARSRPFRAAGESRPPRATPDWAGAHAAVSRIAGPARTCLPSRAAWAPSSGARGDGATTDTPVRRSRSAIRSSTALRMISTCWRSLRSVSLRRASSSRLRASFARSAAAARCSRADVPGPAARGVRAGAVGFDIRGARFGGSLACAFQ
jgi:hypothetical protein